MFAYGEKCHSFCAPIMTTILDALDIELMKQGAKLFEGEHYLKSYCYRPTDQGVYTREILSCELVENDIYQANYFPKKNIFTKSKR